MTNRYDKLLTEFDYKKICEQNKNYEDSERSELWNTRYLDEYHRKVAQRFIKYKDGRPGGAWINLIKAPKDFKF